MAAVARASASRNAAGVSHLTAARVVAEQDSVALHGGSADGQCGRGGSHGECGARARLP